MSRTTAAEGKAGDVLARPERFALRQDRILDAATRLLNEKGVRGMTLQEVARALDLKTTSVTYYYRYKEQLVVAVLHDSLSRLQDLVQAAAAMEGPRERVAQFIGLYFDQFGRSLQGQTRPLAMLSEIRALEGEARQALSARYQAVLRTVRSFFGEPADAHEKSVFDVRTQILNECIFWTECWLHQYRIADFAHVGRRLFDILDQGIANESAPCTGATIMPDEPVPEAVDRRAFLRVATRLINDIGYNGASIDRITSELNVTKGSFYHHVDAKDELILECSRESYERLARLQELVRQAVGTGWPHVVGVINSALAIQLYGNCPLLRSTALQTVPGAMREIAIDQSTKTTLWFCGELVDAMREGSARIVDPLLAGHLIMSTINSAYDMRHWARRQHRDLGVEIYGHTLMRGLFHPQG